MTSAGPDASTTVRLGAHEGVDFLVARTRRPWELDLDAIVVSVGAVLGGLGNALEHRFPTAAWSSVDFARIVPDRPQVLDLPGGSLRLAILVTPHERGLDSTPTLDAVRVATASAVQAAAEAKVTVLGLPLLAAGVLDFRAQTVAPNTMSAALQALSALAPHTIRKVVFIGVEDNLPQVIASAWRSATDPSAAGIGAGELREPAGGVSADLVDPAAGIPLTHDRLGVAPYVSMLATVIADRNTPLPLSVGVFGPWGSGKSYFMGLLREQVDELARSGKPPYHSEIVQIGFNAWHYADSNLWASLGEEIFSQLAGPQAGAEQRRELLGAKLAAGLEQRKVLEAATDRARHAAARLRAEVDEAVLERRTTARDLISALGESQQFRERLDKVWRRLGVDDTVEQGTLLAEDMRSSAAEAEGLRSLPNDRRARVGLATAAVVMVAYGVAALAAPALRDWLAEVTAACTVAAGVAVTVMARVRVGMRALRALSEELRGGMDRAARRKLAPDVRAKLDDLRTAEATQNIAQAQLDEVVARVGRLGRELSELAPGARLYAFLAERAGSDSYTSRLGLVSTIRKDFEYLVELMRDWRDNPAAREPGERPIERIVLYIDDLDRCSPPQVIQVLEAVHLLLAMELFVVVVGVDPRWLLRSLCTHYADLVGDGHGGVLPEDYLEKIINIPLTLPGMETGSLRQLLRSMVEQPPVRRPGAPSPIQAALEPELVPGPVLGIEHGSEVDSQLDDRGQDFAPRPLTEPELEVLASLDHLVGTPRQAKRLFNLYRMLRATRNLSEASDFLGTPEEPGEYQAVAVLLAVVTGYGRTFGRILDTRPGGLLHRFRETAVPEFFADLRPREADGAWSNGVVGVLGDEEVPTWSRLCDGLEHASRAIRLADLSCFQLWAPRVRRFSYVLAPAQRTPGW